MKKGFSREFARDLIALGSPIFFILVIARIFLLSNFEYLSQFLIAGILFFSLAYFLKGNIYSGSGLIVLTFAGIYYNDLKFGLFGFLVYLGLLSSLVYLKYDKKEIFKGIIFGIISTGISWYAVRLIF